jgi:hypothetical protein
MEEMKEKEEMEGEFIEMEGKKQLGGMLIDYNFSHKDGTFSVVLRVSNILFYDLFFFHIIFSFI